MGNSLLVCLILTVAILGPCFPAKDFGDPPNEQGLPEPAPEPAPEPEDEPEAQAEPEYEPEPQLDLGNGDGDGAPPMSCGWSSEHLWYGCSGMGEDPEGTPLECPPGLVEGDDCGVISGIGCCDANGDNWYCAWDPLGDEPFLFREDCA